MFKDIEPYLTFLISASFKFIRNLFSNSSFSKYLSLLLFTLFIFNFITIKPQISYANEAHSLDPENLDPENAPQKNKASEIEASDQKNLQEKNFISLGTFDDWEAFSMINGDETICWIACHQDTNQFKPIQSSLSVLMVSIRLDQKERDEFSYKSSYNLQDSAPIKMIIDNTGYFKLSPRGMWAWLESSIDDSRFVITAQKGNQIKLHGTTNKDKSFTEIYSLIGFTAAYNKAFDVCNLAHKSKPQKIIEEKLSSLIKEKLEDDKKIE